jgi:hypothetical protein
MSRKCTDEPDAGAQSVGAHSRAAGKNAELNVVLNNLKRAQQELVRTEKWQRWDRWWRVLRMN